MNVLGVERSYSHFLENSIETALLFVDCGHIVVCTFATLDHPFFLILIVDALLGTYSIYLLVRICRVLNDILLFLFS